MPIEEGLLYLPPGYNTLALKRYRENPASKHNQIIRDVLHYAFTWDITAEGHEWWAGVNKAFRSGLSVGKYPPLPDYIDDL